MAVYKYKTPEDRKKLSYGAARAQCGKAVSGAASTQYGSRTRQGAEQQVYAAKSAPPQAKHKKRTMKAYMVRIAVRKMQERRDGKRRAEQDGQRADAAAVNRASDRMADSAKRVAGVTTRTTAKYGGIAAKKVYGAARDKARQYAVKQSVRRVARRYRGADGKARYAFRYAAEQKNRAVRSVRLKKGQRYRLARGRLLALRRQGIQKGRRSAAAVYGTARDRAAKNAVSTVYGKAAKGAESVYGGTVRQGALMRRAHAQKAADTAYQSSAAAQRSRTAVHGLKKYQLRARKAGVRKLKLRLGEKSGAGGAAKKGVRKIVTELMRKVATAAKSKILLAGVAVVLVVSLVAAPLTIIASPLGLLFADENIGVDGQSVQQAYMAAQAAWTSAALAGESYDRVEYEGTYADSVEVLAVFAVKVTEQDGFDAMTMGPDQREILTEVYMDMNPYTKWYTKTEDGDRILHIRVGGLSADQAADKYHFTKSQRVMLHELLEDYRDELSELLGSGTGGKGFSAAVLALRELVEKYAAMYGISNYVDTLLAIIEVESDGRLEDVMQSSESMGLPPNSLSKEASINQGCKYFSQLVRKAKNLGCDEDSVIQAYNYGSGFLDFVASHGKKYSFELAEEFSRQHSGGVKVTYKNEISIPKNGGWRYNYGNMFYVLLVRQYHAALGSDMQNRIVLIAQNYQNYGITAPAGYCEMWAEQVYRAAGVQVNNWCCAGRNRVTNVVSTDSSNIPVGAMVYNDPAVYNSRTSCGCGLNAGHVGIYLGNGQIMSNIGGSAIDTLESWTSYYGFGGWGWGGAAVN